LLDRKVENRIVELCKERKLLSKQDKNISIYPHVAVTIANEFGIHFDSEKIRDICRRYRERNSLDEYFSSIGIDTETKEKHNDLGDSDLKTQYKTTIEINKDGSQSSDKLILMSEEDSKDINFY
jgi:hypothetical protein